MPSSLARSGFVLILIHRILILLSVALLGLGWYIKYIPQEPETRSFLLNLHISFGLTSAILLFMQIVLRIVFRPPPFPDEFSKRKKLLAYTIYLLIYASFTLMLISGYLQAVFNGAPIQFWGAPLPVWGAADVTLAKLFEAMHGVAAFVLAGAIFAHVGFAGMYKFKRPGIAPPTKPLGAPEPDELVSAETKSPLASKKAQNLAKTLRRFGWFGFWIQFVLASVSGLLLAVATVGRGFSPGRAGFGDAIYWSYYGFMLLCFAALLTFYYTRVARKVSLTPDFYFHRERKGPFWILSIGMLTGLVGVIISLFGLALSINLLVAKTVSIPPGIMMMDPTQVIRALDIFVLVVNFCLLMGHFFGAAISLWLSFSVAKVHNAYMKIS